MSMTTSSRRIALVTGGGRGLGRAMAMALLDDGHDVIISSTDRRTLDDTLAAAAGKPGRIQAIVADLAVSGEAERLADEAIGAFGQVDILINNAGIGLDAVAQDYFRNPYRFWRSDRAAIERYFNTNTIPAMILAIRLAPAMIDRGWGRIVANTTSLNTMLMLPLYGGSKAALEAETAVMAADLVGTGVTANVLVPGGAAASRITDALGLPRDQVLPDTAMGPPARFLASDASNEFNGRRILARRWDTALDPVAAADAASDPIAWTGYGSQAQSPALVTHGVKS